MRHGAWMMAGVVLALTGCGDTPDKAPGDAATQKAVLADGPKAEVAAIAAADVPAGVRAAVLAKVPDLTIDQAERKARGGLVFYDVEGMRDDGSAVEIDVIEERGAYRVVEVQRDIAWADAPAAVRAAADTAPDHFVPERVIESAQNDGTVIYELFAPGKTDEPAAEVNWKDGKAMLRDERNAY